MPPLRLHLAAPPGHGAALAAIRAELGVPDAFPPAVEAAATAAVERGADRSGDTAARAGRRDRRDLELVTVDPPGSRDLDQAYGAVQRGSGYRVHYAIADVGAFVVAGDALDQESRARGVTLYSPDRRAPLYPPALSEGAASLLPGVDRPAVLWTLDLDQRGALADVGVERATVRSRRQLDYRTVQATVDDGSATPSLQLLREVGQLRLERERDRGGVSLPLPAQDVVVGRDGALDLRFDGPLPVERWNEQVSLLTGMAAAQLMLEGRIGLLRTLPPAPPEVFTGLRASAAALGVPWPGGRSYPDFVRSLDARRPSHAAVLAQAARTLRGASYTAFDGPVPDQPLHGAIAAPYAHVTAPLRRLADRFANEVVLALAESREPPEWALAALPALPATMDAAHQRQRALERAIIDFVETVLLGPRVGEVFDAVVTTAAEGRATVQLLAPAVLARVDDPRLEAGATVRLRLDAADPGARRLTFSLVEGR